MGRMWLTPKGTTWSPEEGLAMLWIALVLFALWVLGLLGLLGDIGDRDCELLIAPIGVFIVGFTGRAARSLADEAERKMRA